MLCFIKISHAGALKMAELEHDRKKIVKQLEYLPGEDLDYSFSSSFYLPGGKLSFVGNKTENVIENLKQLDAPANKVLWANYQKIWHTKNV